ncbi:MAG: glycosyltransferase family 2 protein [Scytolyngbya sp. HA4215-MV1]|jgi:glycosyltransferase involved in cell wall biosynthesis|nr:glycosyltransferase family 2 protein [Scytolyngbya sp. HA4215-MV1]
MTPSSTISVIITCYSEGELILDAIRSVQQQTLPALEIIVVNDGATDPQTIATCQTLERSFPIKVLWREVNGGTSAARNDGFQVAQGDVIVLLDADDILPENALELIQTTFDQHADAGFIYGSYIRQNQPDQAGILVHPGEVSLRHMLQAKRWSLSSDWKLVGTTPLRKSLWEKIGGYDLDFGIEDLHDVEFWMRAIATHCSYYSIPQPIYIWRKYLGNNSRRVTPLAWYRVAQKHLEIYCQLGLAYRAYELLLLGSKWLNNSQEIHLYSRKLIQCIQQGKFQFSSWIILVMPARLLQFLAAKASQKR